MKEDGEFAEDEGLRSHRLASLVVFGCWVVAAGALRGFSHGITMALYLMMPVAWIWCPLSFRVVRWKESRAEGRHAFPEYPQLVRGLAWIVLMVIPLLLFNSRKWKRDRENDTPPVPGYLEQGR